MNPRSAIPLCYSLALLCMPIAFQLAANVPANLPDGLWLMLVVSVWAGLLVVLALCVLATRVLLFLWGACRVAQRARLTPVPGATGHARCWGGRLTLHGAGCFIPQHSCPAHGGRPGAPRSRA